jgi:Acetyltransferases, including N-acetylases of ribosomal proteins
MSKCDLYESERLIFRPLRIEDAPSLHKRWNEASRMCYFSYQRPETLTYENALRACESSADRFDCDILSGNARFPIAIKSTDEIIGNIAFTKTNADNEILELAHDCIEMIYEIGEDYQNKGYATEAVKASTILAFTRLCEAGAEIKIVAMVEHENVASTRVLEKAGFTLTHATESMRVYEIKG